jgi:nucleotide-binding universal stress UspA family protein
MKVIRPEMERRARQATACAVQLLQKSGIEAEEDVRSGDPRMVITETSEEWTADLILIRSHVYTDFSRWMLGTVAHDVLRWASCSVEENGRWQIVALHLCARNLTSKHEEQLQSRPIPH